ncbi:hypothetical protein Fcan01_18296, partial [Folsomia candida]
MMPVLEAATCQDCVQNAGGFWSIRTDGSSNCFSAFDPPAEFFRIIISTLVGCSSLVMTPTSPPPLECDDGFFTAYWRELGDKARRFCGVFLGVRSTPWIFFREELRRWGMSLVTTTTPPPMVCEDVFIT